MNKRMILFFILWKNIHSVQRYGKKTGYMFPSVPRLMCQVVETLPGEALANLKEAVSLYLENARELGMLEDIRPALIASQRFQATIEIDA